MGSEHMNTENRRLNLAQKRVLADVLGLDMKETQEASIEFGSGSTIVRWTGRRVLTAADTATLLSAVAAAQVEPEPEPVYEPSAVPPDYPEVP